MDVVFLQSMVALFLAASSAPQFTLRDTTGGMHTSAEWARAKAVVVLFVTIDCPVGNSYVPELNRIHEAYAQRGVVMWAVHRHTTGLRRGGDMPHQVANGVPEAEGCRFPPNWGK